MELTREHHRAMTFYDFKAGLNQDECFQRLQLAFANDFLSHITAFRWFKKFCRESNSLQDEEHTGRPLSPIIPDNLFAIQKILLDGNRCPYQVIQ